MITLSQNKEKIFKDGLSSKVVIGYKNEVINKINAKDSSTFSTSCQNYLVQVLSVFCKALAFRSKYEDIDAQNTLHHFKIDGVNFKEIVKFVFLDVLNNKQLFYEIRSAMINEKGNGLKHVKEPMKEDETNANIGQIIIIINKIVKALNEFAKTKAFDCCKLYANNTSRPTTKDQMFNERQNEYYDKIKEIKLKLTFGGDCVVDKYTDSAKFSLHVEWAGVNLLRHSSVKITIKVGEKVVMDSFPVQFKEGKGHFYLKFNVPKELIGENKQTITVFGEVYAIGSRFALLRRNRTFYYKESDFTATLSARIVPCKRTNQDESKQRVANKTNENEKNNNFSGSYNGPKDVKY